MRFKLLFFMTILFYTGFSLNTEEEFPFKKIVNINIKEEERKIITYKKEYMTIKYLKPSTEIITHTDDLGIYLLNLYNEKIYYNDYENKIIKEYNLKDSTVKFSTTAHGSIMLGINTSENKILGYMWGTSISRIKYPFSDEKKNNYDLILSGLSSIPEHIEKRLYYIRYHKNNKFILTIAINEEVDFIPLAMENQIKNITPKESIFPIPEKSLEPLPCHIYLLDIKGPIPVDYYEDSEYKLTKFNIDLSDYGVKGELKEDSSFKIGQLVDYSRGMKKIAFIGRVYKNKIKSKYKDYLFLVDEKGGKPESVIELNKGKRIYDMMFNPEGDKLVIDIDNRLYILSFK